MQSDAATGESGTHFLPTRGLLKYTIEYGL
jgi:hypothetical protein